MAVNPYGWSATAASNTSVDGVSIAEACAAANLNNMGRSIMAGVKEYANLLGGAATTGGSGNAQTLTTGMSLNATGYAAGQLYGFEAGFTNTGSATLAVDGLTAKTFKTCDGSNLAAGNITAGGIYLAAYEPGADVIILLNPTITTSTIATSTATITDNRIVRGDGGARGVQESLIVIDDTTGTTYPSTNDSGSIGKSGNAWSDLFLADGAVVNFNAGNVTITHSAGLLTIGQALTVTGAIIGSSTFSIGTSGVATVGTIELGHADDTTLTRSAAGKVAVNTTLLKHVGKETIWVPAAAMVSRTTNGAASGTAEMATNKNMFRTLDFDTTTQEFAQFEIFFPKSWNLGTVTFQPVLSHASGSGNVVFGLAGVARSNDDAGDVAFGTAQTSDTTVGTANDIYIGAESSAITIAGSPAAGDTVQFQINRTVASDNLGVDARLHGVRLFFTTNAADDT